MINLEARGINFQWSERRIQRDSEIERIGFTARKGKRLTSSLFIQVTPFTGRYLSQSVQIIIRDVLSSRGDTFRRIRSQGSRSRVTRKHEEGAPLLAGRSDALADRHNYRCNAVALLYLAATLITWCDRARKPMSLEEARIARTPEPEFRVVDRDYHRRA